MKEPQINVQDLTEGKIKDHPFLRLAFDGSCEPTNPGGVASIGWLIFDNVTEQPLAKGYQVVADGGSLATNNFAEYCALGFPLRWLKNQGWQAGELQVTGDSNLVVKQVTEQWKCNAKHLQKLRKRIWDLLDELGLVRDESFIISWVPRTENEEADSLGRVAYEEFCASKKRKIKYMPRKNK